MSQLIYARDHGILPGDDPELVWQLRKLLDQLREDPSPKTLVLESGVYHFYPDLGTERLMYISNHEEDGLKRVAWDLSGQRQLTIDAGGSSFLFHGAILPFFATDAEGITLQNFTIDYPIPGYSEATVLEALPREYTLQVDSERYPFEIRHGQIRFPRPGITYPLTSWLEFDASTLAPVYQVGDIETVGWERRLTWTDEGHGRARVTVDEGPDLPPNGRPGNRLVLRHHPRNHPGIYIIDSRGVTLSDIIIHHSLGMSVLMERTSEIELDHVSVALQPEVPRIFTACADATHFVSCPGPIHIHDGLFENMLDDPINIHGIYVRIRKALSPTRLQAEWVHEQQKGVPFGAVNDAVRIVSNLSLQPVWEGHLQAIEVLNKDWVELELDQPIPSELQGSLPGFVVENLRFSAPDVLIENNIFRNNRARGPLLTSHGEVIVRNNLFECAGSAILIEGDANFWFESGATKAILIQGNTFRNCCYVTKWGRAPIQVSPAVQEQDGVHWFHRSLRILDNHFITFDERIIDARALGQLTFRGNILERSSAYPPIDGPAFRLEDGLTIDSDLTLR